MVKRQPVTLKLDVPWEIAAERLLRTPAGSTPPRPVTPRKKRTKKKSAKR